MSLQLSSFDYGRQAESLRPELIAIAYQQVGHPLADQLAQDAISQGFEDLGGFNVQTGSVGFAKWLKGILGSITARHFKQQRKTRSREISFSELRTQNSELWEIIDPQYEAAHIARMERDARVKKLQEIALRMRYANLSDMQTAVLAGKARNWTPQQTADALGCTLQNVYYHLKNAIRKLNEVDLAECELQAADLPRCLYNSRNWEGGNHPIIYHAPQKTGAALAIEDLRRNRCSANRHERVIGREAV